jgi:hypothetical protein
MGVIQFFIYYYFIIVLNEVELGPREIQICVCFWEYGWGKIYIYIYIYTHILKFSLELIKVDSYEFPYPCEWLLGQSFLFDVGLSESLV